MFNFFITFLLFGYIQGYDPTKVMQTFNQTYIIISPNNQNPIQYQWGQQMAQITTPKYQPTLIKVTYVPRSTQQPRIRPAPQSWTQPRTPATTQTPTQSWSTPIQQRAQQHPYFQPVQSTPRPWTQPRTPATTQTPTQPWSTPIQQRAQQQPYFQPVQSTPQPWTQQRTDLTMINTTNSQVPSLAQLVQQNPQIMVQSVMKQLASTTGLVPPEFTNLLGRTITAVLNRDNLPTLTNDVTYWLADMLLKGGAANYNTKVQTCSYIITKLALKYGGSWSCYFSRGSSEIVYDAIVYKFRDDMYVHVFRGIP